MSRLMIAGDDPLATDTQLVVAHVSASSEVDRLLRQQAAIAEFGSFALRHNDLMEVLTEAARVCAEGLGVRFSKICRYRAEENHLLIEAGIGWQDGVVGHVVSRADASSPQGCAFITGRPSICNDLRKENDFELPPFYADHGIVSTVDVIIQGDGRPYGVLEIDNDQQHDYDQADIEFLTGFANVLAEAVSTAARAAETRAVIDQLQVALEQKNLALEQKAVLAEELQHRVRNNLQLVYGMLSRQMDETADQAGRRGLMGVARRVSTLAEVYNHLLGSEMTRTTNLGGYLESLCRSIAETQEDAQDIALSCASDHIILDLDTVTLLGLIVAELVANSYHHAFPDGRGTIAVAARQGVDDQMVTLTIADNGRGFTPPDKTTRHGLSLVRRLVAQAEGTIEVDSVKGGATWTIKIHAQSPPPAPSLPQEQAGAAA